MKGRTPAAIPKSADVTIIETSSYGHRLVTPVSSVLGSHWFDHDGNVLPHDDRFVDTGGGFLYTLTSRVLIPVAHFPDLSREHPAFILWHGEVDEAT